jgi:exonuclease SbcC
VNCSYGTPAEMEAAVVAAVGLPYEQFTSCVVLPQGEFARFLHAKPAERQEILVNLLGLRVYQEIARRAGVAQKEAEAAAAATRSLLDDVTGADDASLAAAVAAVEAARSLVSAVEDQLPALAEANDAGQTAQAALVRVSREIETLAGVRVPAGLASLGDEVARAVDTAEQAAAAVHDAEEHEEKQRVELAALGDRAALQRLLDDLADRTTLTARVKELAAAVTAASKKQAKVASSLEASRATATTAASAVTAATAEVERAQTADRAGTLRVHLVKGEPCPVCEQPVATVPATAAPALRAAREQLAAAEQAHAQAQTQEQTRDRELRELERTLAGATAQHDESARRLSTVESQLKAAPAPAAVKESLAAIVAGERLVAEATAAVKAARAASRAAATAAKTADERLRGAWRGFDTARDAVAAFGPPAPDRDDLVGAWAALHGWASEAVSTREAEQARLLAAAEDALAAIGDRIASLTALFDAAGVALPSRGSPSADPAAYRQAAALAVERATAAHTRVVDRRAQVGKLSEQVAEHERAALVAKALALHLRADRFERWLLEEALDSLVLGASRILRELSNGQYDLSHHKGEFFVVDHSDASLPRAVRTLSGGETFQASLALALALSEQLAGLSTAASLESIILDEGFGTLDASTLDVVAATLENLAASGDRSVGVVTHVAALAERIPVRFEVSRDARGAAHIVRTG